MPPGDRRILVCGPALKPRAVDGLQDVLRDLVDGLRSRGWMVDTLLWPEDYDAPPQPMRLALDGWRATLGRMSRSIRLPDSVRLAVRVAIHDRLDASQGSALLDALDTRLASRRYDVVLACLDTAPVGLAALVTRAHPRPVLLSLQALGRELRAGWLLALARRSLGRVKGTRWHPDLFKAVDAARVPHALFGSEAWRDDAIAAGLPAAASFTTCFGVPCPAVLAPAMPPRSPGRLLWGARLSPEKGLHHFLPAVALVRERQPIHLTVLAGLGTERYRAKIDRLIRTLHLDSTVTFAAPVARSRLPQVLAAHDTLLFASPFRSPVAQMLLHAFAHGLVVVGPEPGDPRSVLQANRTAFCFRDSSPPTIAAAIARSLGDTEMRRLVREQAFELARTSQSLDRTIDRFDALLTDVVAAEAVRQ
ncbi:MAG: glycosyltransferase family 4 protein [Acidobacteriota bacterium]